MDDYVRAVLWDPHQIQVGERIGGGGFGDVYAAVSAGGVPCAIKVSRETVDVSAGWAASEMQGLEQVKGIGGHPNVVTLFDIWWINGYLVTRWELGEISLEARLRQNGEQGLPHKELLVYMRDAADGIDFLNRKQSIYHRDIKPDNLMLFHGRVKLADLGLAKFAGASVASHSGSGTLGYVPPEGYEDHRLSPTIDVYSLAATYLRLRTGNHPFGDPRNPMEVVQRQLAGKPILNGLGRHEAEVIAWALARQPENRPQDGAKALVARLSTPRAQPVAHGVQAKPARPIPVAKQAHSKPAADRDSYPRSPNRIAGRVLSKLIVFFVWFVAVALLSLAPYALIFGSEGHIGMIVTGCLWWVAILGAAILRLTGRRWLAFLLLLACILVPLTIVVSLVNFGIL